MRKPITAFIILALAFSILSGCSEDPKYYAGESVSQDDITRYGESILTENATDPEEPRNTLEIDMKSADSIVSIETYYWTPNGTRYHVFKECSSLARSKTILSGSLEEGQALGKSGLCKNCEKKLAANEAEVLIFMLTNIMDESTEMLCYGEHAEKLVEEAFPGVKVENNAAVLPTVVSRKKQVVPDLMRALSRSPEI